VLARPVDSPRFGTVEAEFSGWLAEAYPVGEQRHLE
jgi:hypothetical protein